MNRLNYRKLNHRVILDSIFLPVCNLWGEVLLLGSAQELSDHQWKTFEKPKAT